jgi:hypothetical protein
VNSRGMFLRDVDVAATDTDSEIWNDRNPTLDRCSTNG